jgi:exosortase/archaeosortase family protein
MTYRPSRGSLASRSRPGHRPPPVVGFCLRFAALVALSFYLYETLPGRKLVLFISEVTASTASYGFGLIGLPSHATHDLVSFNAGGTEIRILDECTGAFAIAIYVCFITAFPSSVRRKLLGAFLGTVILVILNLLRILAAGWILRFHPALFKFFHDYLWQLGFMAVTTGLGLFWAGWALPGPRVSHERP